MRRILRIWPLYFVIVLSGFFLWPHVKCLEIPGYWGILSRLSPGIFLLFVFFSANVAHVLLGNIPYLYHTWSIAIEEQFYLGWPWLMKIFKKNMVLLMLGVMIVSLLIRFMGYFANTCIARCPVIYALADMNPFGCMALGGLAAFLYSSQDARLMTLCRNRAFQLYLIFTIAILLTCGLNHATMILALAALFTVFSLLSSMRRFRIVSVVVLLSSTGALLVFFPFSMKILSFAGREIHAALFGLLILFYAIDEKPLIRLDFAPLRYLGRISYGIYMYHNLLIVLSIKAVMAMSLQDSLFCNPVIYSLSFFLTVLVSSLSYHCMELPFLRLKSRFQTGASEC